MSTFQLHILSADRVFFEGESLSLTIPTAEGQYGVLAHHRNMIAAIVPGLLKYRTASGEEQLVSVSEGMLRVENNDALVLVDTAERQEDIDIVLAQRDIEAANEVLRQKKSVRERELARSKIVRALSRIKVKEEKQ